MASASCIQEIPPNAAARSRGLVAAHVVGLAAAYAVVGRLGLMADAVSGFATLLWAPSGIALAALILRGPRLWPGVAIGALVANVWSGAPFPTACAIAAGNTLEAWLGARALRSLGLRPSLERVRDVLGLVAVALLSTTVSATVGTASLSLSRLVAAESLATTWRTWWLGDMASELIVAPVILTCVASRRVLPPPRRAVEAAALAASIVCVWLLLLYGTPSAPFRQAYLFFPLLIWAALRFDQGGVAAATLLATGVAVVGTALGRGRFAAGTPHASLMSLQLFLGVIAASALVLGAVIAERERAEQDLRDRDRRLDFALHAGRMAAWSWEATTDRLTVTGEVGDVFGCPAPIGLGEGFLPIAAEDAPRRRAAVAVALRDGGTYESEYRVIRADDGRTVWVRERAHAVQDETGRVVRVDGVSTDVTAWKLADLALREADRRKDEFLGVLSHELRNPLAPIRNCIHILDRTAPDGPQARHARGVIGRQVAHLARLVDDLLDVTRIARGKIELRPSRVALAEVVSRAGEDHRALVEGRGALLSVALPRDPVWVDGDDTRLAQIVGNLLQNAAKFTDAGGHVFLSLAAVEGAAEIRVRDTGAGIDGPLLEQLFQPFTQGRQTLARTGGGLGLGLALVKGLAELHGGTAEARSDGPGAGAEFIVRLPLAPCPLAAEARAPDGRPRGRRQRVLVVEDNEDVAQTLAQVVEMFGHDVEIAPDGPSAIEKARTRPPDVVLCDIGLPGMDGYEVARVFRADPALTAAQLVAVTGYAQPEDVRRARRAGFDHHLAKPADLDAIERLLA